MAKVEEIQQAIDAGIYDSTTEGMLKELKQVK
jgi:hypothetical protein